MLVTDILARLRTDSTGFNSGMRQASSSLTNFQKQAQGTNKALMAMGTAAKLGMGVVTTAVGMATTALVGMGVKGMQAAAQMEQLKIAMVGIFEGTGKSAQDAYDFLDRLAKFAAKTPFEFASLAETSKKLMAVGYEGDQVIDMLDTMGNAAAAAGKGSEAVLRLANSFQRAKGSGRLTGETIMMISEAMPTFNARAAIANELFGGDMPAAMKALETATLPVDDAIQAMLKGMKELPGAMGAMDRQSRTLIGIMSTFKDEVNMAMVKGLEPALPAIESALTALIEPVASFMKNFGSTLGPAIAQLVNTAAPAIMELAEVLGPTLATVIRTLGPLLQSLLPVVSSVVKAFGEVVAMIAGPLGKALNGLMYYLQPIIDDVMVQLVNAFKALLPAALPVTLAFLDIVSAILPLIPITVQLLTAVVPLITMFATFVANIIHTTDSLGLLAPIIYAVVGAFVAMKVVAGVTTLIGIATTAFGTLSVVMAGLTGKMAAAELATLGYGKTAKIATASAYLMNTAIGAQSVALLANARAWVAQKAGLVASTIATAATTVATWALNVALLANPLTWIVLAIVAFVGALVLAYNNLDGFRKLVDSAFSFIGNTIGKVIDWMKEAVPRAFAFIKDAFLKYHPLGIIISNWDKIFDFFTSLPARMLQMGKDIVQGLINGIKNLGPAVLDAIKNLILNPIDTIKGWLGIASPSKVTTQIGEFFGDGYRKGIDSKVKDGKKAAKNLAMKSVESLGTDEATGLAKDAATRHYTAYAQAWAEGASLLEKYMTDSMIQAAAKSTDAATRHYSAMGAYFSAVYNSGNTADIVKLKQQWGYDLTPDPTTGDDKDPAGTTGTGEKKRLANIYIFGKLMGKNYGRGFNDGYKSVRSVTTDVVDKFRSEAQRIVDAAKSMMQSMKDFGKFSGLEEPSGYFASADDFITSMRERIKRIEEFNNAMKKLSQMNLNKTVFSEIAAAGPVAGMEMAMALIAGGETAVAQINELQKQLTGVSKTSGDVFVQATEGVDLATAKAKAGMTVNFTKDSIKVSVGEGISKVDKNELQDAVEEAIRKALKKALREERRQ